MYFAAGSVLPNSPLEIIYFTPLCTFFLYNIFVSFLSAAVLWRFCLFAAVWAATFFIVNFTYFHIPNT